MTPRRRLIVVAFVTAAAAIAVTERGSIVSWLTTEHASWQYVEEAWGGLDVPDSHLSNGVLRLELRFHVQPITRMDSGICVRRASARVAEGRILVGLQKCVCNERLSRPPDVSLRAPSAGVYEVAYDDREAGLPRLGKVQVR